MAEKKLFGGLKSAAQKGVASVDVNGIKDKALVATGTILNKAEDAKEAAVTFKEGLDEKRTELDRMLQDAITEYNNEYTLMNDTGLKLFMERCRAEDTISFIEELVNSIAAKPKTFETEFEQIMIECKDFKNSCDFADRELSEARKAVGGAGAGLAAGASVAFMAPTAAMWVATTFGTASTGTAIASLSGAAATNAALAWLGGGAVAAGGGGMAAGEALLALAGPIGWGVAGVSLLSSIVLFTNKKTKLDKQKNEEIESVKKNTEQLKEISSEISAILEETTRTRDNLSKQFMKAVPLYGADYRSLNSDQKMMLGTLVNNTKTMAALFDRKITEA